MLFPYKIQEMLLNDSLKSLLFKSANSNNLNAWLFRPKHQIPEITLLELHGNGGLFYSQYKSMKPLLKFGGYIFLFDYSGYSFSQGKATRENILKDATSAVSYLTKNAKIQNTIIVVYEHSRGGNLAAIITLDIQDSIEGLIILDAIGIGQRRKKSIVFYGTKN